ncbi:MAG: HNH endonuclease [Pseudonocardia sp.]|nr:HNH endonuclease [Pseudonocardia sp.]
MYVGKDHPTADRRGWIAQHRLVVEQQIGRPLLRHERVHHKNGRRADNRPENLELWRVKGKDPAGVRASDYQCPGCRCHE